MNQSNNPQVTRTSKKLQQRNQVQTPEIFVDAVRGTKPIGVDGSEKMNKEDEGTKYKSKMVKTLSFTRSKEHIHNTLVGELENFHVVVYVKAFQEVEGCPMIQLRYLGGLKMLLEFVNLKEKEDFLNNGKEIWQPWFKNLTN